jgi:DNA helicase-2/ATP-dependent DNA helicase PcrA
MLLRIKKGMRVRHPMFGAGRIVERSGAGESTKVTVVFDNGSTRKLLLRYAPLTPA